MTRGSDVGVSVPKFHALLTTVVVLSKHLAVIFKTIAANRKGLHPLASNFGRGANDSFAEQSLTVNPVTGKPGTLVFKSIREI
jgi:hypothetical protein